MTPERWSDDRISDLAARLEDLVKQVRTVAGLTTLVSVHDAKIDQLKDADEKLRIAATEAVRELKHTLEAFDGECEKKIGRIDGMIADLQGKIETQEKTRFARDRDQERERKADRRWLIGTVLASTSTIVAAVALLADKL